MSSFDIRLRMCKYHSAKNSCKVAFYTYENKDLVDVILSNDLIDV